jgi:transposase
MLRLRDDQWERIREHFPEEHIPDSRPGRKPSQAVLEAVLWILNTSAQWSLLPRCYPKCKTVHQRFQQWCQQEVLREVLTQLANTLRDEGTIDERESFIDAPLCGREGGRGRGGPHEPGEGREDSRDCGSARVTSLGQYARREPSRSHLLVQLSFDFYMLEAKPEHLVDDRAYDSDSLDDHLKQDGVNLIAPHRSTRKLKTQDGWHLRRYEPRWFVERFVAWLQWKRRLLIRWEYYATNSLGFVQLAYITMLLKQF